MIDISGVDLNLLATLDALLAESNVTRAATRLNLTQPAVSAQLSRLRQLFGDPLLLPAANGRGMTPTPRALELAEPLQAALQALEAVVRRRPAFDPHADARRFVIAASDQSVATLGLALMRAWPTRTGPRVRLAFVSSGVAGLAELMERGQIDLLLGSERMMLPALKARRMYEERFVVAQRKAHPRGTAPYTLEAYCALEHVLVSTSGGSFFGFMDEHLEALGRTRQVALSLQHFTLVPEILACTDYISTLPERLLMRCRDRLDLFDLPFEARGFTLFAGWHARNHNDPAHTWLRETISEIANMPE